MCLAVLVSSAGSTLAAERAVEKTNAEQTLAVFARSVYSFVRRFFIWTLLTSLLIETKIANVWCFQTPMSDK